MKGWWRHEKGDVRNQHGKKMNGPAESVSRTEKGRERVIEKV